MTFNEVFDNSSLGLCTKTKVHIKLLPNAKEGFIPKRPVPYAVRSEIEMELQRLENAATIKLMDEYCSHLGNPEQLVLDNGTQFCSSVFEQWCNERAITHTRTVRFHPSSNGQAERFVDTFKRALKKMEKEGTTAEILQRFLEVYRSIPNSNSPKGASPAEAFLGRKMRTIFDALKQPSPSLLERNLKIENQYNCKHGTKSKSFKHGDLNRQRPLQNIDMDRESEDEIIKAHSDQLRTRIADVQPSPDNTLSLDILLQDFEIRQTSEENSPLVLPSNVSTSSPPPTDEFITPPTSPIKNQPKTITQRRQPVEPISRSPVQT
ncbi:uncharacterized protein K02A2.6-like [Stomoxys calcitrans]|uniref:uncharacterized protein K02A2.6-like n=1 Tax=Stomoxys calcitrans TaxID=35570 RepID=UPI0027E34199|nr:uncharacterized protein K02A2.6-like [Stomoxys calcitrans]